MNLEYGALASLDRGIQSTMKIANKTAMRIICPSHVCAYLESHFPQMLRMRLSATAV